MTKYIKYLLIIVLLLSGQAYAATTYYMDDTGNDSNSCVQAQSTSTPKLTLTSIMSCVSAGDTIKIRGGTYVGQTVVWTKSGTEGNEIIIKAYEGESPIFNGVNKTSADFFMAYPGYGISYITIEGLELHDYRNTFLLYAAHNITVKNNYIHDGHFSGVMALPHPLPNPTTFASDIVVEGNIFKNIGYVYTNCSSSSPPHSIYFTSTIRSVIRNNKFINTTTCPFDQVTFHGSGMPNNVEAKVYNNIFYASANSEKSANVYGQIAEIYNNTFYNKCTTPSGWCFFIKSYSNPTIKNNIFYADHAGGDMLSGGTFTGVEDHNLWYPAKDSDDAGGSSVVTTQTITQIITNLASGDFSLIAGSDAINAGVSLSGTFTTDYAGTTRPVNTLWDIGAYEYDICSSYTWDAWGACSGGQQTRTYATKSPTGCTLGTGPYYTTQSCEVDAGNPDPDVTVILIDNVTTHAVIPKAFPFTVLYTFGTTRYTDMTLYYDTDNTGYNGTLMSGCDVLTVASATACTWNTSGITPGTYYIYAKATDGTYTNQVYLDDGAYTVTISPCTPGSNHACVGTVRIGQ